MKNGSLDKVRELELKVMKQEKIIKEFLEEIDRISEEKDEMELKQLTVNVNGHKYKII